MISFYDIALFPLYLKTQQSNASFLCVNLFFHLQTTTNAFIASQLKCTLWESYFFLGASKN